MNMNSQIRLTLLQITLLYILQRKNVFKRCINQIAFSQRNFLRLLMKTLNKNLQLRNNLEQNHKNLKDWQINKKHKTLIK